MTDEADPGPAPVDLALPGGADVEEISVTAKGLILHCCREHYHQCGDTDYEYFDHLIKWRDIDRARTEFAARLKEYARTTIFYRECEPCSKGST